MENKKKRDFTKELVELNGDSVGMREPVCVIHKQDHPNCEGCPSELGCGKLVRVKMVNLIPTPYHPLTYKDFKEMDNRIQSLIDQILKAKTKEELNKIPLR